MVETHSFKRSHSILISAPAGNVLDYVCNPNSWPEWLAASHKIDSPDRPLRKDDTFVEEWHTRSGPAQLNWVVTECEPPHLWVGETQTDFIGTIIVRYDVKEEGDQVRFTRTMINPARPKPPTQDQINRLNKEADIALANIKKNVEARIAKAS
ncbi:SRPBCC family protein [Sneathiella litorea]|uniref:SRPBCC family protein n=1 Tax=Sneathiella litorea TaxID=2606216 RepID=A0A6L8WBB1_9PROT|nr:SRPBCC family protein [Sneathiella litorea]MZR31949.1 SRPBCC family protein [Sneathiella litorea]